jgi:ATP-binding cassette subfamily B protein/subfamily B ATP-binding cassette protein MsbA
MKNFLRALKYAWPYRYRVLLSVVCAMLAAILWGLNFTAIYPVLKILGGENLQKWVDKSIGTLDEETIPGLKQGIKDLELKRADAEQLADQERRVALRKIDGYLANAESKLESARHELYRYQVAKRFISAYVPTGRFETLAVLMGLVIIAVALKGVFEFCQETLVGNVVNRSLFDLRNVFFRRTVRLDVASFSATGSNELMARCTNDMETLGAGMKTLLGKIVAEPLRALACIAVACWIHWQLTMLFLILVPISLYVLMRIGRNMKRATRKLLDRMSNILKIVQETYLGIRIVKAFSREAHERLRFRAATKDYYQKAMWVVILDALAGPIIEFFSVIIIAAALLVGAYIVLARPDRLFGFINLSDTPIDMESLLQLYALLAAIADPVRKLSSVYTRIQAGWAAADRIFGFLDREPGIQANGGGPCLEPLHQGIEFQNVCFSYDPGHPILSGVNLRVKNGEVIALVGKNGCGKTTLLNLLPRFFDPDHGTIFFDGVDIRTAQLRSLRKQIGIVTQDTILFDDTIYSNIAYGKPNATKAQVEEAARQARAHDFILKLPKGYETRVGEAGTKLSGGQKQRLSLARAILSNPSVLVLDEFTSQADAETEMEVHRIVREFMRGRTTFLITHRFHTLEIADRIVVLDQGRVVAEGSHSELLQSCALYQRLHEAHAQRLVA